MSKRRLTEEQSKKAQFPKELWLLIENVNSSDGNGSRFEVVCVDPRVAEQEDQHISRDRWLFIQPDGEGPPRLVLIRYLSRSREIIERLRRRHERDKTKWTSKKDEPPKKMINMSICPSSIHSIRDAKRALRKKTSKQRLEYAREDSENECKLAKRRWSDRTRQSDGAIPSCSGVSRTRRLQTPSPPLPPSTPPQNSIAEDTYSSENERPRSSSTDKNACPVFIKETFNNLVKSIAQYSEHISKRSEKTMQSSHRGSLRGYEYHRRRLIMSTPSPECRQDVNKPTTDQATQTDPIEEDPAVIEGQNALAKLGGLLKNLSTLLDSFTEGMGIADIDLPDFDSDISLTDSEIKRFAKKHAKRLCGNASQAQGENSSSNESEAEDDNSSQIEPEEEDEDCSLPEAEAEDEDFSLPEAEVEDEDCTLAETEVEDEDSSPPDAEVVDEESLPLEPGEEDEDSSPPEPEEEDEESLPLEPEAEDEDSSPLEPEAEDEESPPPEPQAENNDSSPQPMRRVSPPVQASASRSVRRVPTPQQPIVGSLQQADGGRSSNESGEHFVTTSSIMGAGSSRQRMVKVRRVAAHTTNIIERAPGEELVPIGNGRAMVPARLLEEINWNSYTQATRQLLQAVFPRRVLATHSLTGKRSPAFMDKPPKKRLNPQLVEDVVIVVMLRCGVTERLVRNCITIKCTDEAKLYRNRQQCRQGRLPSSDEENVPPNHTTDETTETSSGDN